jgi:hypothetical protein
MKKTNKNSQQAVIDNLKNQLNNKRNLYRDMVYNMAITKTVDQIMPINNKNSVFDNNFLI